VAQPERTGCHSSSSLDRAWDLGEEKDREVQKFPLNRGDNKPRRCEQHFSPVPFRINFALKLAIVT